MAHRERMTHLSGACSRCQTMNVPPYRGMEAMLDLPTSASHQESPTMLDPKIFEDITARLSAVLAASPAADIEKNARALLASFFDKLDLVSREEFDIQAQVLLRTREKIKALEARLDALENPAGK